jgi:hypothetical protein
VYRDGTARRTGGDREQLLADTRRVDLDTRSGCRKQFGLPGGSGIAAGHHDTPAVKGKEDRQPRERGHLRRTAGGYNPIKRPERGIHAARLAPTSA